MMRHFLLRRFEVIFFAGLFLLACIALISPTPVTVQHPMLPGYGGVHAQARATAPQDPPSPFPGPFTPVIPSLPNPGQIVRDQIITPITNFYRDTINWLNREGSVLTYTEPTATYSNDAVVTLWRLMLALVDSVIVFFFFLAGYEVIAGGLGFRYANALELLPRILVAFVGANLSLAFATFWIQFNNVLCSFMDSQTANQPLPVLAFAQIIPGVNIATGLLILIASLFAVFIGLQALARLALIVFLIVLLPLLFALLASRRTQNIGVAGIGSFIAAVIVQFLQLTSLTIGVKMLLPFLQANIGRNTTTLAPVTTILAAVTVMWLTLRIPGLLRQWSLSPVAESGRTLSTTLLVGATRVLL